MDFERCKSCTFTCVEYFLTQFKEHLPSEHADSICDEFRLFQSLSGIPSEIEVHTNEERDDCEHVRADDL